MNILLVFPQAFGATGGVQRFCRNLLAACQQPGTAAQVACIALLDEPQAQEATRLGNVRYTACSGSRLKLVWTLLRELRHRPQVVILAHLNLAPLAFLIHWLSPGSQVVAVLHGFEAWERVQWLKFAGLQRCSALVSVSHFTRERFCAVNGYPEAKVQVLHLALDPAWELVLPPASARIAAFKPYLLSVSRLEPGHTTYKGLDDCLQALAELAQEGRLGDYRYLIAGEGMDMPRLQSLAAAYGLAERVIFTGRTPEDELQQLFANSQVFLLPSRKEGFGLVYLEAMAYARPVIAAQAGAVPEVVMDGETGLLVQPGDVPALKAAIFRLINEPETRQRLGQAGLTRLQEQFTFPAFSTRLVNLITDWTGQAVTPH